MDQELYKEHIIDLYKNPHNKGSLSDALIATRYNATCGDAITVYVRVNGHIITDMRYDGIGCVISEAAASLMSDFAKGKTVDELCQIKSSDVERMLGIPLNIVRMRCANLVLDALHETLKVQNRII